MFEVKDNYRILFIGDSITDVKFNRRMHRKLKGKNIYALQVSKELNRKYNGLKVFYKGIASNRTYHVYDRLTKDCIDLKPDIIVMLIGVNDAWENYVPEQYPPLTRPMLPHIKEIFRRINAEIPDAKTLLLLPFMIDTIEEKTPFHKVLDVFRSQLKEVAEINEAEIVDLQIMFNQVQKKIPPAELATDGIHPTNLGHEYIAKEVLKHLSHDSSENSEIL